MPLPPGQRSINVLSNIDKNGNFPSLLNKPSGKRPAASPAKGTSIKRSALQVITNQINATSNTTSTKKKEKSILPGKTGAVKTRRSIRLNKDVKIASSDNVTSKHISFKAELKRPMKKKTVSPTSSTDSSPLRPLPSLSDQENSSPEKSSSGSDGIGNSPMPVAFHSHALSPWRTKLNFADLDDENFGKIHETPEYALVIFEYMRYRESLFYISPNYLADKQTELTPEMRSVLVDWMVEVQENFELNHETLYLSVKLVDLHLQKVAIQRKDLQLIGATSILIAAKFDERHAPYVEDILYICDDAYTKPQLMETERQILKTIGYDINIPISYRFLRRFAKVAKTSMETLTLARFILELSLQQYSLVSKSDSLRAAAALWLALKMQSIDAEWTETLIYYSSYKESEIYQLAGSLNKMIIKTKGGKLQTVWQKYTHSIFYEVAKTAPLTDAQLATEECRIQAAMANTLQSRVETPAKSS